jgi:hypothetical protein
MLLQSISNAEKKVILNTAKKEVEAEVYKSLVKLGYDAEVFQLSDWSFDADSEETQLAPDFSLRKYTDSAIQSLNKINTKLSQL